MSMDTKEMRAAMVSFAAGIWISVMSALAWLAERSSLPGRTVRLALHAAGSLYLLGLAAIGIQTALGRTVWEMSALPLSALACFVAGLGVGLLILRAAFAASHPTVNREA